jgi:hypothetical protein
MRTYNRKRKSNCCQKKIKGNLPLRNLLCARLYIRAQFFRLLFIYFWSKSRRRRRRVLGKNFRAFDRKRHAQVLLRPIQLPPIFWFVFFCCFRSSIWNRCVKRRWVRKTDQSSSFYLLFFFWPGVCWTQFSTRLRSVVYNDSIKLALLIFFFFYSFFLLFLPPSRRLAS